MRVVMQEVERARRETATALAKAAADKRAGDHRERASAKETAAAKASARALSDRLRFLALECVVMQRPKLERQRRLVMSWTRWCKNVYGSGSVRSSVIATGARTACSTAPSVAQHQQVSRRPYQSSEPMCPDKSPLSAGKPVVAATPVARVQKPRAAACAAAAAPLGSSLSESASGAGSLEKRVVSASPPSMPVRASATTAREHERHGATTGVDGLAARWLQGAADVATRWLKPSAGEGEQSSREDGHSGDVRSSCKQSFSRSADGGRREIATRDDARDGVPHESSRGAGRCSKGQATTPMEEMARYGSPRIARGRDEGRSAASASKKGKDGGGAALLAQAPTASDVAQLKKMILASCGKDGAPRLDSVSLYSLGKLLGKGAFGAVKMGVHKLSGAVVAIKNFKKADVKNEVESRAIDREIRILKQSVHQHIIRLYEVRSVLRASTPCLETPR